MNLILTDIDETLLDFSGPFRNWLRKNGWKLPKQPIGYMDVSKTLGLTDEETDEIITSFTRSEDFGSLPALPYAAKALFDLYCRGWRFVAITASIDCEENRRIRLANLQRAFGFAFEDCHCMGFHRPKAEILATFEPTIWVEDSPTHAAAGAELGHRTFLINGTHNSALDIKGTTRVKDWRPVVKAITG